MRTCLVWLGFLSCLALIGCGGKQSTTAPTPVSVASSQPSSSPALDLEGNPVDPLTSTNAPATLMLFVSTECPISNRYAPEIQRLHETFASEGVRFWMIYPNPDESTKEIRRHMADYQFPGKAMRDVHHKWVRKTGATVTPEAALYDARRELIYRGRIDNWYVDFGQARPEPTRHDLQLALEAVLTGQSVTLAPTKPVGCYIPELQ